jgi:YggT family protein
MNVVLIGARALDSAAAGALTLASARTQIADYLSTLIYVYTLLIILFIVIQLLFSVGLRPPYSRTSDAVLGFLRDICDPFLRVFRRVVPALGGIDFSPILAIFALQIINRIVVQNLIHG